MNPHEQNFLNAEEAANKLVETVHMLQTEIAAHKSAKEDFLAARQRLESLVDSVASIVEDSSAVLKELRRVGAPEILRRCDAIESLIQSKTIRLFRIGLGVSLSVTAVAFGVLSYLIVRQ